MGPSGRVTSMVVPGTLTTAVSAPLSWAERVRIENIVKASVKTIRPSPCNPMKTRLTLVSGGYGGRGGLGMFFAISQDQRIQGKLSRAENQYQQRYKKERKRIGPKKLA